MRKKIILISLLIILLVVALCGCSLLSNFTETKSDYCQCKLCQLASDKFNAEELEIDFKLVSMMADIEDVAEKNIPATVLVRATFTSGFSSSISSGSGFVITEDGYIVTNAHVVVNEKKVKSNSINVIFETNASYYVSLIDYDYDLDLAVLKINTPASTKFNAVSIRNSDNFKYGQPVVIIGNPDGVGFSVNHGNISNPKVMLSGVANPFIQIDSTINHGNSGGPLFDMEGKLIGVVSRRLESSSGTYGVGYAIPSTELVKYLKKVTKLSSMTFG